MSEADKFVTIRCVACEDCGGPCQPDAMCPWCGTGQARYATYYDVKQQMAELGTADWRTADYRIPDWQLAPWRFADGVPPTGWEVVG